MMTVKTTTFIKLFKYCLYNYR